MSFRYWVAAIALGLTAWSSRGLAQETVKAGAREQQATKADSRDSNSVHNQKADPEHHSADEFFASMKGIESAIRDLIPKPDEEGRKRKEAHESADLKAQQDMSSWGLLSAIAALLTTLITGIGLYFLMKTMEYTRLAAKHAGAAVDEAKNTTRAAQAAMVATQKIGEIQTRAYLNVTSAKAEYLKPPTAEEQIRFMVIVKNKGQSPAQNVRCWATCHASPTFDPRKPVRDGPGGSHNPIGPDGELKFEFGTCDRYVPIEKVHAARRGSTHLWVHGVVDYDDIYDREQTVEFRFHVETGLIDKPALQICADGNRST